MAKIFFHSPFRVIAVTMGNNRQINGPPRIDVKFSGDTVNAFARELNEFH